jgi:nucleotide-binding universal stress UspA family protein
MRAIGRHTVIPTRDQACPRWSVVKEAGMKRILVALDGSEHSDKALDLASDLAAKHGAELVLLHVIPDRPLSDAERRMAETEYLEEVVTSADVQSMLAAGGDPRLTAERLLSHSAGVARRFHEAMGERLLGDARRRAAEHGARNVQTLAADGNPARAILARAQDLAADMVVLGSRGLGDAQGLLLGSVSHKVAHLATCTCVTVK